LERIAQNVVTRPALDYAPARIPQEWVPVLLRNQVYADCVYLLAVEYAQGKFRKPASRDNQLRIDR
jgi:hypothetical protein